jgi:hypothetical protein
MLNLFRLIYNCMYKCNPGSSKIALALICGYSILWVTTIQILSELFQLDKLLFGVSNQPLVKSECTSLDIVQISEMSSRYAMLKLFVLEMCLLTVA